MGDIGRNSKKGGNKSTELYNLQVLNKILNAVSVSGNVTLDLLNNFSCKTEILTDTPEVGDQTIFTAYTNVGTTEKVIIQKTVILENTPNAGNTDITDSWAITATGLKDQLEFNKKWSLRYSYNYEPLSF